MDEEFARPEPKISLVIGIFGLLICIVLDSLSFIPFVADVEEAPAIVVLILSAVFGLGGPIIAVQIVTDILKALPVVQELPLWTVTWIFVWWLENSNSKIARVGQQAINAAAVAEGSVEEFGEAGEALAEGAEATAEAGEAGAGTAEAQETFQGESENTEVAGAKGKLSEGLEGENSNKSQEKQKDIELGDEVEPELQAQEADFELPENMGSQGDDEDEDDEDFQQAA